MTTKNILITLTVTSSSKRLRNTIKASKFTALLIGTHKQHLDVKAMIFFDTPLIL